MIWVGCLCLIGDADLKQATYTPESDLSFQSYRMQSGLMHLERTTLCDRIFFSRCELHFQYSVLGLMFHLLVMHNLLMIVISKFEAFPALYVILIEKSFFIVQISLSSILKNAC